MPEGRRGGTIAEMPDVDRQRVCDHGLPPDDCPLCGSREFDVEEPWRADFDPQEWVAAYVASAREPPDLPAELLGVPLS